MRAFLAFRRRALPLLTAAAVLIALAVAVSTIVTMREDRTLAIVLASATAAAGLLLSLSIKGRGSRRPPDETCRPLAFVAEEGGLPVHPATGLYRRWVFQQRLIEEYARAKRYGHPLSLLLLAPADPLHRLDPQAAADHYSSAARRLRKLVRTEEFLAQFDDCRFVLLLPESAAGQAEKGGLRLLRALASEPDGSPTWIGAFATYPSDAATPDALVEVAEIRLRRAAEKLSRGTAA